MEIAYDSQALRDLNKDKFENTYYSALKVSYQYVHATLRIPELRSKWDDCSTFLTSIFLKIEGDGQRNELDQWSLQFHVTI